MRQAAIASTTGLLAGFAWAVVRGPTKLSSLTGLEVAELAQAGTREMVLGLVVLPAAVAAVTLFLLGFAGRSGDHSGPRLRLGLSQRWLLGGPTLFAAFTALALLLQPDPPVRVEPIGSGLWSLTLDPMSLAPWTAIGWVAALLVAGARLPKGHRASE